MAKRVALVLGSGGARGYAHIGVIEELERRGYQIDCIAGCSMGSVIGGVYAAGKLAEYRDWVSGLDYLDVIKLLDVGFGNLGAIRGEKVFGHIREMVGDTRIEELPIAFTAVATDLTSQQEIWFQQGCLHQAMRASAAIPSLFAPVRQGNRVLVDGGLLNPLPIVPVVSAHCDMIIAVNLNSMHTNGYTLPEVERPPSIRQQWDQWLDNLNLSGWLSRRRSPGDEQALLLENLDNTEPNDLPDLPPENDPVMDDRLNTLPASMLELINLSFETMQASLTQYKIAGYPPDLVIDVPKRLCRFFEFYRAPELIELGRIVASDALDQYEARQAQAGGLIHGPDQDVRSKHV
ncbi:patatin-like phospholipase family protein [Halopseudomonas salegens]|uniref:NTE family protein n=1 Tax=Halopseudomonas salegens TaxID=1434072 RepID=A0A1H2FRR6_9GAMM|nr:patatin-like phospholipase family protein [Halopseudomonas salegens]SDU10014.1 NTE family protein [Halopseudomonas salegens]